MTTLPKSMLSARDLSERLGISKSAAYTLMRRLPAIDLSGPGAKYQMLRVREADLARFLKQKEIAHDWI